MYNRNVVLDAALPGRRLHKSGNVLQGPAGGQPTSGHPRDVATAPKGLQSKKGGRGGARGHRTPHHRALLQYVPSSRRGAASPLIPVHGTGGTKQASVAVL